jgi:hypothetical protein
MRATEAKHHLRRLTGLLALLDQPDERARQSAVWLLIDHEIHFLRRAISIQCLAAGSFPEERAEVERTLERMLGEEVAA